MNTPAALNYISSISKEINKDKKIYAKFLFCINFMGFDITSNVLDNTTMSDQKAIEKLINERNIARSEKNFKKADEIRQKLLSLNIEIKDDGNQTTWEYKPK